MPIPAEYNAMMQDCTRPGNFLGRREILSPVKEVTRENLLDVLGSALAVHKFNQGQIDYLWWYMRNKQPILQRQKEVRPEICNNVVENHAYEIVQFTSGYIMGEPVAYVRHGSDENASEEINLLNDYMAQASKASHDKNMSVWMADCAVGYRMILPKQTISDDPYECPFEIDTPDPRTTFVVYHSGFGHKRLMAVQIVKKKEPGEAEKTVYCGYTERNYFEVNFHESDGNKIVWKDNPLGDIPIFEYRLNLPMMGSFEPAIGILDAMNTLASNRVDGVETFVQSLMIFKNVDIDADDFKKLRENGAIKIKSAEGKDAEVLILSQELNQTQTQALVDYMYDQVLTICGLPTSTKGGASTSDTGSAVFLRDGWSQCESRARDTELLFKQSEMQFLKLVLSILRRTNRIKTLRLSEIECKFTRRQHDNLMAKAQSLLQMLEAGLHPEVATAASGIFNDPMDVYEKSKPYMRKWEYKPIADKDEDGIGGDDA